MNFLENPSIIKKYQGTDATIIFNSIKEHNETYVLEMLDRYCIGKE